MISVSRKLGVLGGLSRPSTIRDHNLINREVLDLTCNRATANLITWSFDPDTIVHLLSQDGWPAIAHQIEEAVANLLLEGVDGLMITSDTLHCVLERESVHLAVPVLHIRDALIEEIRRLSLKKVGFIGTSVTMSNSYYGDLIRGHHDVDVVLPNQNLWVNIDYSVCNRIYNGECTALELENYNQIMTDFEAQNVDGIVVASSEIALAFNKPHAVPVLHTARIHAAAAARWCVAGHDIVRPALPRYDELRSVSAGSHDVVADDTSKIPVTLPYSDSLPYPHNVKRKGKRKTGASLRASVGEQRAPGS
ncbi:aspartate/glutamate racemase family protein [Methylobacterium sp. WL7]|uniref:aspartate/glutamate racemase family protein n=1 Tax=Methylobacterium sp. WL7 TaxID=2603900 RepID=UPI00164EEC27|nr:aspartate/glutamate racemase family protein [Methylobacterium sp. WL7]